jgi:hypothetical protein
MKSILHAGGVNFSMAAVEAVRSAIANDSYVQLAAALNLPDAPQVAYNAARKAVQIIGCDETAIVAHFPVGSRLAMNMRVSE